MLEPWAWRHKRWKKLPWYHLFERRHLAGASRLLMTSESEARNLTKLLPEGRCHVLPLGFTAERQPDYRAARRTLDWHASEVVLLFLSRIDPKKGLHTLLRALAGLEPSTVRNVRLVIVGGGEAAHVRELKSYATQESSRLPRLDSVGEIWVMRSGSTFKVQISSACHPIPKISVSRSWRHYRSEPGAYHERDPMGRGAVTRRRDDSAAGRGSD